ncbi:MAG: membrane integrity-associated transporter subunit PqiC [Salinarimonas sp.]|nr:membrane integrity-associated transporter subunit PqiC [Salinarimonas sp.]
MSATCALLAACGAAPALTVFTLSAPEERISAARSLPGLLLIAEPSTIQIYNTERIVVRGSDGSLSYLPGAQWADQLPELVQSRMVATFENTSRIGAVSRPGDRVSPDFQINTEIRRFEIDTTRREAVVELALRATRESDGRIARAQVFRASAPVGAVEGGSAVRALDEALSRALVEIVNWAGSS